MAEEESADRLWPARNCTNPVATTAASTKIVPINSIVSTRSADYARSVQTREARRPGFYVTDYEHEYA